MDEPKINTNQPQKCKYHNWYYIPQTEHGYKMDRECKHCKATEKDIFPAKTFDGFIRRFVHNKLTDKLKNGKEYTQFDLYGRYKVNDKMDKLTYEGKGRRISFGVDTLAIRLKDGRVIGNASRLLRCGSYRRGDESPAQAVMQKLRMALIPFNIFEEANMDIRTLEMVEQGKPEMLLLPRQVWGEYGLTDLDIFKNSYSVIRPKKSKKIKNIRIFKENGSYKYSYDELLPQNLEKRHFIGAMLFKVNKKLYLFDVDRREIEFYRFNAFLSEIADNKVKTIKDAYESLKPKVVKDALKAGKKVKRQGEWFFIPTKLPKPGRITDTDKKIADNVPKPKNYDLSGFYYFGVRGISDDELKERIAEDKILPEYAKALTDRVATFNDKVIKYFAVILKVNLSDPDKYTKRGELRAGQNRPNNVETFLETNKGNFVKGRISHSGREHEDLNLIGWHIAVPNTAIKSFTITGRID